MGVADLVSEAVDCPDHRFGNLAAQMVDVGVNHARLVRGVEQGVDEVFTGKHTLGFAGQDFEEPGLLVTPLNRGLRSPL